MPVVGNCGGWLRCRSGVAMQPTCSQPVADAVVFSKDLASRRLRLLNDVLDDHVGLG
jgi:hypothetical protein